MGFSWPSAQAIAPRRNFESKTSQTVRELLINIFLFPYIFHLEIKSPRFKSLIVL